MYISKKSKINYADLWSFQSLIWHAIVSHPSMEVKKLNGKKK